MRVWKAACCAALVTLMAAPGVRADEWNKKTILTFSGPVQIPGATLAAGTYVFKLADLIESQDLPQIRGAARLDTSPLTKGKHVSRPEPNLSASPTAASQEDAVGKTSPTSAKPLPSSIAPDAAASGPQHSSGKEPR